MPVALKAERMKPLKDIAVEGRANPAGIPVLYLSLSRSKRPSLRSDLGTDQKYP